MERKITNELFLKSITDNERILEKEYILRMDEASDKEYASAFYQNLLFLQNELVPYVSIVFHELEFTFQHHVKLYGMQKVYDKTMAFLPDIRLVAKEAVKNARLVLNGNYPMKLHDWYTYQIEHHDKSLSELIELEEKILKLSDENLAGALSLHIAGQRLYEKFKEQETDATSAKENPAGQFTLNERILALYILLESLGFKQGLNEDRTTLAALYHLIMDSKYNGTTTIKNSNIYKALGSVPNVVKDAEKLNKYLQNIRPTFENANMKAALKVIDEKIRNGE